MEWKREKCGIRKKSAKKQKTMALPIEYLLLFFIKKTSESHKIVFPLGKRATLRKKCKIIDSRHSHIYAENENILRLIIPGNAKNPLESEQLQTLLSPPLPSLLPPDLVLELLSCES